MLDVIVQEVHCGVFQSDATAVKMSDDSAAFFVLALLGEPMWRLGQEDQERQHDHREEGLESNGKAPLGGTVNFGEAVIDPVGHHDTEQGLSTINSDNFPTVLGT